MDNTAPRFFLAPGAALGALVIVEGFPDVPLVVGNEEIGTVAGMRADCGRTEASIRSRSRLSGGLIVRGVVDFTLLGLNREQSFSVGGEDLHEETEVLRGRGLIMSSELIVAFEV